MNKRIISDYLESLKEDDELDYIFPLLLESMGFKIVTSPKCSKGQNQYGKDIVAIGKDVSGTLYRWYFELKGNAAKDINEKTFNVEDGVRDSIQAAIDVDYVDHSIPEFNRLPRKIVFVHNGILKESMRPQFDGFIKKNFPNGGFERWGIETLTDLFSKYLFDECLYRDDKSYRLVKKILALYDAPGWMPNDIEEIIELQLSCCPTDGNNNRKVTRVFCGINLILAILFKECTETLNLLPAKRASDKIVLNVWSWIIENNLESKQYINKLFSKIVSLHLTIYKKYINKLYPLAIQYKGLYMPNGTYTEKILYPLRCYEFLKDVLYFYYASLRFVRNKDEMEKYASQTLEIISTLIRNNPGFDMLLLDTNSIPFLLAFKFICMSSNENQDYYDLLGEWTCKIVTNIIIRKRREDMLPELYGNRRELAKSLFAKSPNYRDKSSLLLMWLIEILYCFNMQETYESLREIIISNDIDIQVSYPIESETLEVNLFKRRLHKELSVECGIKLPEQLSDLKDTFKKRYDTIKLRTSTTQFDFLIYLAHLHYETDWFPDFIDFGFLCPHKDTKPSDGPNVK